MIKSYVIERMYVTKHLLLQRRIKKNIYDIEIITWIFLELHPLIPGVAKTTFNTCHPYIHQTFLRPSHFYQNFKTYIKRERAIVR